MRSKRAHIKSNLALSDAAIAIKRFDTNCDRSKAAFNRTRCRFTDLGYARRVTRT